MLPRCLSKHDLMRLKLEMVGWFLTVSTVKYKLSGSYCPFLYFLSLDLFIAFFKKLFSTARPLDFSSKFHSIFNIVPSWDP